RTYVVSQNYRYTPDTWTIADLVRQGKIGEVGQVNIDFFLGMDFGGGFRHSMEHPLIVDMSIHHCDLIRFITGLNPVSVSGDSWNPPWSNYDGDVSNSLLFEMDNGARISYSGSWASKGIHCSWNGNWMIQGDKGSITYDKDGVITLHEVPGLYSVEKTTVIDKLEVPHGEGQAYVLNRFIHCIENGETPETIVDDNIFSVAMVYASVEAVESGKKVPVLDDAFLALLK
ncbi:MAG: Gfo/Idh/MocA family oxidoreductase, partial [Lentisphaeria bacterium]|nr:Gfo/Idh/MocA family oxidoreductase [Lentisphaeria bacterium]